MDVFAALKLMGGVAFFLYGMNVMSASLEKMSGGRLERTLNSATSSKAKSLILGMGITVAIQSSSTMTVMLVGLVNSGLMQLHQTVGVIMGSNIGTTLTVWVLALAGIESENVFLKMLSPENFAPLFAVAGIILMMTSDNKKRRDVGNALIGFAVLMFGMVLMKESVASLEGNERFAMILTAFKNPILGVLAGMVFTGVIQSSAASIGLLQTFASTVGMSYGVAMPIVMGQNIGTCVTALLSSVGVNKNAKRVAVVHIYFNLIGTILCLTALYGLNALIGFTFMDKSISPLEIALVHSIFNITVTAVLLPFGLALEKLAQWTIRDKTSEPQTYEFLDERLLNAPSFAIAQCQAMAVKMCGIAKESVFCAISLVSKYDEKIVPVVRDDEALLDMYEDNLGAYLVKLSAKELSTSDNLEVSRLLHAIGDFERMGDHALNIMESAEELKEKGIGFSEAAQEDLKVLHAALEEVIDLTVRAIATEDVSLAKLVEPLEQVIDELVMSLRSRHIIRLQNGKCSILPGFIWSDLMINYERVSDHCSNLASSLIQTSEGSIEGHMYMSGIKSGDNPEFTENFKLFKKKYKLADP
ncbi:MAG: Na/Pi cotransporter family protein [Clostridiales bacterium]|jgi:phosphate:Na+ symporter|nr:Na/Pi cotransporter family protein [Clostridiales bacterium]